MFGNAGQKTRVLGFGVLIALCLAACTSEGEVAEATTSVPAQTTAETPTTTAASTSTTLSPAELKAQAEVEIRDVVNAWFVFSWDTSLGEAGTPLEFVTGVAADTVQSTLEARTAAGEVQRARGGERIEITSPVAIDLDAGRAEMQVCTQGDGEVVDAETGEVLAADGEGAWEGQIIAVFTENGWKVSEFFSAQARGGEQCVLDS